MAATLKIGDYTADEGGPATLLTGDDTATVTVDTTSSSYTADEESEGYRIKADNNSFTIDHESFPATNSQTFYAATVTSIWPISAPLFTNAQTFYGPDVSQGEPPAQGLEPSLLTNSQSFYGPTVTLGDPPAQEVLPPLTTNTQSFPEPLVMIGEPPGENDFSDLYPIRVGIPASNWHGYNDSTVRIYPPIRVERQIFYAPTVTATKELQPPLLTNTQSFPGASVSGVAVQTLSPSLVTNSQSFPSPTIINDQLLEPGLVTNTQDFPGATVSQIDNPVGIRFNNRIQDGASRAYIKKTGGRLGTVSDSGQFTLIAQVSMRTHRVGTCWFFQAANRRFYVQIITNLTDTSMVKVVGVSSTAGTIINCTSKLGIPYATDRLYTLMIAGDTSKSLANGGLKIYLDNWNLTPTTGTWPTAGGDTVTADLNTKPPSADSTSVDYLADRAIGPEINFSATGSNVQIGGDGTASNLQSPDMQIGRFYFDVDTVIDVGDSTTRAAVLAQLATGTAGDGTDIFGHVPLVAINPDLTAILAGSSNDGTGGAFTAVEEGSGALEVGNQADTTPTTVVGGRMLGAWNGTTFAADATATYDAAPPVSGYELGFYDEFERTAVGSDNGSSEANYYYSAGQLNENGKCWIRQTSAAGAMTSPNYRTDFHFGYPGSSRMCNTGTGETQYYYANGGTWLHWYNGKIRKITVTNPGGPYLKAPIVTVGGAVNAVAHLDSNGAVEHISVIHPGDSAWAPSSPPTVTIASDYLADGGTPATAVAVIANGTTANRSNGNLGEELIVPPSIAEPYEFREQSDGGVLRLKMVKMPTSINSATGNTWRADASNMLVAGKIDTYNSYTARYGWWEAKLRVGFPTHGKDTSGHFGAYWPIGKDNSFGSGPYRELDAIEWIGRVPHLITQTVHHQATGAGTPITQPMTRNDLMNSEVTDWQGGWHRFAVHWQPASITLYVDGVITDHIIVDASKDISNPITSTTVMDQFNINGFDKTKGMSFLVNLALNNRHKWYGNEFGPTTDVDNMYVDIAWVCHWRDPSWAMV